jgi:secreted PhoX family phosphatase
MFINVQHPGEPANELSDPKNPRAVSNWPDKKPNGRPRSATVVIRKADGGVIGT